MAVSEEDLEKKRAHAERVRQQIADAEAKASSVIQEESRAVEAAALDTEIAQLEARLAAAKEQAKVSTIRSGTSDLTAHLQEAKKAAAEVTPPGVTVDTNADDQPKNTTGATVAVEGGVFETTPDGTTTVAAPEKDGGSN